MIKNGDRFWDESNGRYLTVDGFGRDPKTARCVVEEFNEDGELEIIGTQLFTERELKHFKEVAR